MADDLGQKLHDRATRGEKLTPEEESQLEAWYAAHDAAESRELAKLAVDDQDASLETQIRATLTQIVRVTQQIQDNLAENATLRKEIASLRLQLAEQSAS